jgi:hypothetical protein
MTAPKNAAVSAPSESGAALLQLDSALELQLIMLPFDNTSLRVHTRRQWRDIEQLSSLELNLQLIGQCHAWFTKILI